MKSLYIAGPIEGVKNYRERFAAAQAVAEGYEWAVLNPAALPAGLAKEAYMQAKADPAKLGFPVCVTGTRVRIPRRAFLHWMEYGNGTGKRETA